MSRARENADGARLDAPLASPTFSGTVAIPNVANLETAVVANTAKVTNYNQTLSDINALDVTELGTVTSGSIGSGVTGGSGLTATPGGILVIDGQINGGSSTSTSVSDATHSVFSFTMPANKTKVILQGSWNFYNLKYAGNGWAISNFTFVTNTGTISAHNSNWHGAHHGTSTSSSDPQDFHGSHSATAVLTVSAGSSVVITLLHTKYNAFANIAGQFSRVTAIAY